jgi:fructose-specific component phosphotransferase system IIB-like protein
LTFINIQSNIGRVKTYSLELMIHVQSNIGRVKTYSLELMIHVCMKPNKMNRDFFL